MLERIQFSIPITCGGCGQPGQVKWEENAEQSPRGMERSLIGVSEGFRNGPQQASQDPAIICAVCGTQQTD